MYCTPDREIIGDPRGPGLLSIKNVSQWKAGEWEHEAPPYYQIQLQHEMAVVEGITWGSFAVLIGGNRFVWFDVERNDAFIQALVERVNEFMQLIETKQAPAVDGSKRTAEALKRLYAEETGEVITLADGYVEIAEDFEEIKAELRRLEKRKLLRENQLREAIGAASIARLPAGGGYSLKSVHRKGHVTEATTYRELRRIK
jgi:predicted phage-related endonuclease